MVRNGMAGTLAGFLRWRPQDVGLLLILAVLFGGLLFAGPLTPAKLATTFYLALFIHLVVSAYDGRFDRLRTLTWFLLIGAWVVSEIQAFLSMLLPFGQLRFWLANKFASMPVVGKWLSDLIGGESLGPWFWSAGLLLILALDLLAMHRWRWRTASTAQIAIFVIGVIAAAIILSPVIAGLTPAPPPGGFAILPLWYTLPLYELLRLVPSKAVGVGLAFAAMLVLLVLPGTRTDRLAEGRTGWLWLALTIALAASWIGLGWLGSLPSEGTALSAGRVLAAFHFAYFLVLPFLLGRLASRPAVAEKPAEPAGT
jgi:ubiquinol-cytochrome c reductase cytochrome b/c1 subunit